jgi:hypothetical protein
MKDLREGKKSKTERIYFPNDVLLESANSIQPSLNHRDDREGFACFLAIQFGIWNLDYLVSLYVEKKFQSALCRGNICYVTIEVQIKFQCLLQGSCL